MTSVAAKIQLPDAERGLAPDAEKRFDRLQRRSLDQRLTESQRRAARDELLKIEQNMKARRDAAWAEGAAAETQTLALARGETVERSKSGAVRVLSRDGLLSLLRAGKLTADQYDAGMAYREAWERQGGGACVADLAGSSGGGHDNNQFVGAAFLRAQAMQRFGAMERAVALECRDEPACLQMLRWVAGQGNSPRAFGGGRAYERLVDALGRALDVVSVLSRNGRAAA